MMKRDDCFRVIARHIGDAIVLPVYSSAFDWLEIAPRPLNYFAHGAMGLGSSCALGFALGRPDKRVVALDGDGSLLMNLGSLVTIGAAAPKNLVHFVCRNGTYEANGGHPIANQNADFAGMARAAGYAHCHDFSELASFEQQAGHVLAQDGPVMAVLHIEKGALSPEFNYRKLGDPKLRETFRAALRENYPASLH